MTLGQFIDRHCTACGGNWTQMLYTGLQDLAKRGDDRAAALIRELPTEFEFVQVLDGLVRWGIIEQEVRT
jgi:hypothetical protein